MLPHTEHSDPRRARSRARVVTSAVELLREAGLAGLTIESAAERSGVAKTTIYRQFSDREELHLAAVQSVACQVPMARTNDLVVDVTEFCTGLNRVLQSGDFGALLPTALDGAERSESLAQMMHDVGAQRRKALVQRLRLAQRDGTLGADVDVDMMNSQLVGPLFFRRFISRQPTGPAFVCRHVRAVLTPLVSKTPASHGSGAQPR